MVKQEDAAEFIGQIIDIFEGFLETRGIEIQNQDREQPGEYDAIIYGADYGELQSELESMMLNWGIIEKIG